ncbi:MULTISPECIES: two-component system regulatory protein YycI [Bacillus]|uniref:two-component system regulatory protein YycI n=1 Tax=Bacillus TaxID=1386 RepID=UPI0002FBA57A|nr:MULTISPECIES: two-component system regulatory protein YycI [Bacillus]
MDWSKTKTIFIAVFLVLNIFLLYQYVEKVSSNKLETLSESTLDELLAENEIKINELPKKVTKEQYLSGKSKTFKREDLKKLKGQKKAIIFNEVKIYSKLDKPFPLGEKLHSEALDALVKESVLNGDQYKFWKVEEDSNSIVYYQTYEDKVIFDNTNAKLTLYINGKREVDSYEQTYIENIEPFNEKEEVLTAEKAIETIYKKGFLPAKSEISKVEIGYYNLALLTASHVLTPTWHIVLNGEEDLFVNAIDGQIIQLDEEDEEIPNTEDTDETNEILNGDQHKLE